MERGCLTGHHIAKTWPRSMVGLKDRHESDTATTSREGSVVERDMFADPNVILVGETRKRVKILQSSAFPNEILANQTVLLECTCVDCSRTSCIKTGNRKNLPWRSDHATHLLRGRESITIRQKISINRHLLHRTHGTENARDARRTRCCVNRTVP